MTADGCMDGWIDGVIVKSIWDDQYGWEGEWINNMNQSKNVINQ